MPAETLERFEPAFMRTLPIVNTHPLTRPLERALDRLITVLRDRERHQAADAGADLVHGMRDEAPPAGMADTAR